MAYKFQKGTFVTNSPITGSQIHLSGSPSGSISAAAFYGDGSGLTNVSAGAAGDDTQIQFNNSDALAGSSDLVWDGSHLSASAGLQITDASLFGGTLSVSGAISSSAASATALGGHGLRLKSGGIISTPASNTLITLATNEVQVAGNISASNDYEGLGITLAEPATIGTTGGTLLTLDKSNTLVTVTGNLSASGQGLLKGYGLVIKDGGTIGGAANTNLLTLESGVLEVEGIMSSSAQTKAIGLLIDTNGTIGTLGDTNLLQLHNERLVISGSIVPAAGFGVMQAVAELKGEGGAADQAALAIGMNMYTGTLAQDVTVNLPAPAAPLAGETVVVKANELGAYSIRISGSSSSGSIDGNAVIGLSSSYASVTLVRMNTTGNWMIV